MGLPGDFRRGVGRFGRLPEPRLGGAIRPTSRGLGRCGLTHLGVGSEANKARTSSMGNGDAAAVY